MLGIMTITPFAAARRICEIGNWRVTNMKLNKILYLAQMIYMGEHNGEPLINGRFEAWDYGPVQPDVYLKAKIFGAGPIKNIFWEATPSESEEISALNDVANFLLDKNLAELVAMTHWDKGAWAKNYVPGRNGAVIPFADIIAEYNARLKSQITNT